MKSDDIRSSFLEFFRERGHTIERSDKIVPSNDPTLLFTSAGMVQFKPYYTGEVPVPYRRATTSQKCLRAGGKANDLDEVGKTARHLTFFEMLGNFSFGDYFKRESIAWGWEYSTQVIKIPAESIWISVYEDDDEAYEIWEKEIGIPSSKIVRLGVKENFWGPAGDTGACGPCSEMHVDRGAALGCGRPDCAPGCDHCERFMEFWNHVFPQFDQQPDGSRPPLKNRGIDTGMGLERLAALLQDKPTVFDTDGIFPIIEATQRLTKVKYADNPAPFRVIADHARALSFMIADGVLPGNEGRGYVERRLLRRAARFGRELGLEKPFLHAVSQTVVDLMGHHYPELVEKRVQIEKIILTEEQRFQSTLARGMDLLEEILAEVDKRGDKVAPGAELFRLHDTYGFPLDLATDIATDRGYTVDREGFDAAMARQKEQARSAWAGSGEEALSPIYRVLHETLGDTTFVGYETTESPAVIRAIVRDGKRVNALETNQEGEIILDQTPFYAESGGQVGDTGMLNALDGSAHVSGAKAPIGKMTVHKVRVTTGTLKEGDQVQAEVDKQARSATECHHTATHLLQAALQDILGDHVHQAGSLVSPERLRFDFTHFEGIDPERLLDVERRVNQFIRTDTPVSISHMALNEAREAGAMALFGEKYADVVRVVKAGDISMELCGGTHVRSTGVIGYFKVTSESSIAAGVRRIEAVCAEASVDLLQAHERSLAKASQLLNASAEQLDARVRVLMEENRRLQREVAKWKQAAATGGPTDYTNSLQELNGIKLLAVEVDGQDAEGLRLVMDKLRERVPSGVLVLGSANEGKASLCVGVSKDLTNRIKAGDIVKKLAPIVGGGGGGRPDMAQAGGKHPEKISEAIQQAPDVVKALLG
ncbi:MAG: alanine--tRNA ligase [Candidatus Hydrogenedentes bacterium]|nr:alanine--tRNA ligase [Candidatus Hydrogenedentota bacterium]